MTMYKRELMTVHKESTEETYSIREHIMTMRERSVQEGFRKGFWQAFSCDSACISDQRIAEARMRKTIDIATKMKGENFKDELISKLTGLNLTIIKYLA